MVAIKVGDRVHYTSYGLAREATVIHVSANGQILILDNRRWIHTGSVTHAS